MKGTVLTALSSIAVSAAVAAAVAFLLREPSGCGTNDAAAAWLAANRNEVERQVLADVEKYGVDIYRLHMEVSQMLPCMPGEDFGGDKAVRKLQVTYPDSNVRALAEAFVVYGAVRVRDMLRIEQYLRTLEARSPDAPPQLMPNGFEIEPQLVAAQYNYFFHVGRFDDAAKSLDYLAGKFGGSWLIQPQSEPVSIGAFVRTQSQILEVAKKGVRK